MKNNFNNPQTKLPRMSWIRRKGRNSKRLPSNRKEELQPLAMAPRDEFGDEVQDLTTHEVQTLEYDYYMDSYN